jgi:hypothetical protein
MNAVALVTALAILAPTTAPRPTAAPTESPLKEIGRVRATTPLCRRLATHAVVAANMALEADRTVVVTTRSLRTVNFDKDVIVKHRGTEELRREYASLHATAAQGETEMKKFEEALKEVTDADQRAALKKFAEALAGALNRQKKLAQDMGRYIAWLDLQEPLDETARASQERDAVYRANGSGFPSGQPEKHGNSSGQQDSTQKYARDNPFGDVNDIPQTLVQASKKAADELEVRATLIAKDEDAAADRIDPAFKGC